jgi:hypothetical protein
MPLVSQHFGEGGSDCRPNCEFAKTLAYRAQQLLHDENGNLPTSPKEREKQGGGL